MSLRLGKAESDSAGCTCSVRPFITKPDSAGCTCRVRLFITRPMMHK